MDLQFVTQFMLQHFEQTQVKDGGNHFLARCPLCGDSKKNPYKKRFNLNWNNGVPGWHCWNCGRHGNFIEIYSIMKGISYDDAKKEIFQKWKKDDVERQYRNKSAFGKPKEKKEVEEENFNWIRKKCYSIFDRKVDEKNRYINALRKFIISRKINIEYILYICYEGRYRNRIIIPIFNENRDIIYFQARRIPKTMLDPKYDNPIAPKELCILNRHRFDRTKSIIVHEGLIDAFMVGDQGTSCLGKEVSENLLIELLKFTDKDVIIALDNDSEAYKALAKFMEKNKYARKVKYFLYPAQFKEHDDINSIVRSNNVLNVYELITQNSVSYSTAYTKLSISKLLKRGNRNENNSNRK